MNSIELVFERPWLLLCAIPAFAVVLIPYLMLSKKRRKGFRRVFPLVCHIIITVILLLLLSGLTIVHSSHGQSVMLLVDLSDSTEDLHDAIIQKAQDIADVIDEETPLGALVFADDSVYSVKLGGNRKIGVKELKSDATDIASAMEKAVDDMPEADSKRLIILSDGKETDSDALSTAYLLSTKGVRIDAVYFDTTDISTAEMQIGSFTAPEGVYVGEEVRLSVEVQSNTHGSAELVFSDNGVEFERLDVTVRSGSNVYEVNTVAESSGVHSYNAVLIPAEDTSDKNNEAYAYLDVAGASTVLVIADTPEHAEFIKPYISAENEVTCVSVQDAPASIVELCNYDEVILSNVDYATLPEGYDKMLEKYVGTYGRSLFVAGGEKTYMYGNMQDTAIEEILPVSFELNDDDPANATTLLLVLDCSGSMIDRGPLLSLAKQGAIKCIEAMGENDYVGIISFNSRAYLEAPLTQTTESNKEELVRIISGLSTAHGTHYSTALERAYYEMQNATTEKKSVMFLSDGSPNDHGYFIPARELGAAGVTVSTIGLGYSGEILPRIAEEGGNGRYYYIEDVEDLPNIMENEAKMAAGSAFTGEFVPVITTDSDVTEGFEEDRLPIIGGYLGTTLKDDATAYITTEKGHPIFASWQYGVGTVACFTSDLNGKWTADWFASDVGITVTARAVDSIIGDVHSDTSLKAEITVRSTTTDIVVTTAEPTSGDVLNVSVASGDGSGTYEFSQVSADTYKTTVETPTPGIYELVITQEDSSGKTVDHMRTAVAVSYSKEYDAFAPAGDSLLVNICRYSGGAVTDDLEKLSDYKVEVIDAVTNPLIPLGIVLAVLLISDIAVRKLKWKDIRKYLFFLKPKSN